MDKSIKLSPKYGVNPTMCTCFFCGKETGGIALLGHIPERDQKGRAIPGTDAEAPRNMIMDYDPCDECEKQMNKGITIIGITDKAPDNRPAICRGESGEPLYPTGSWVVGTEEAVRGLLEPEAAQVAINNRGMYVPEKVLDDIFRIYESYRPY